MQVELVSYPTEKDYEWVRQCAVGTVGKEVVGVPSTEWLHRILAARHSPIRDLNFKFILRDVPYFVSVHLTRHHIGVNWYVQSQRNDRQNKYDRNAARQDSPVTMRASVNAEELMSIANRRLCMLASAETREVVQAMCDAVEEVCPEFTGLLVPMCQYGRCHEMFPCNKRPDNS